MKRPPNCSSTPKQDYDAAMRMTTVCRVLVIGEWLLKTFPLMKAAEDEKEDEARMLLERDANVNAKDAFEWTALHWAAVNGRLVAARLLLENGAQVGRENEDGWTALHFAVSQGRNAAMRLLLDRGGDPWSVDVENVWN